MSSQSPDNDECLRKDVRRLAWLVAANVCVTANAAIWIWLGGRNPLFAVPVPAGFHSVWESVLITGLTTNILALFAVTVIQALLVRRILRAHGHPAWATALALLHLYMGVSAVFGLIVWWYCRQQLRRLSSR